MPITKKRNYGVELLRMVAMLFIVILHIAGVGGVNKAYPLHSAGYITALLLRSVTFCAVNCYALISGYVGCTVKKTAKKHSLSILNIFVQTLFWSVMIQLIFFAFGKTGWLGLIKSFFPIMTGQYWYSSAYIGLLLFTPFLNHLLQSLSVRMLRFIECTVFLISTYLTVFCLGDPFSLSSGYSTIWLILMYLLGGAIRLDIGFQELLKKRTLIKCSVCWGTIWLGTYFVQLFTAQIFGEPKYDGFLLRYVSLPNLFVACVLLAAFASKELTLPKWLEKTAKCSFGVYLIHTHPIVFSFLIINRFGFLANTPFFVMFCGVLLISATIYVFCTLLEYTRQLLFKAIHVETALEKISDIICRSAEKIMAVIQKWTSRSA